MDKLVSSNKKRSGTKETSSHMSPNPSRPSAAKRRLIVTPASLTKTDILSQSSVVTFQPKHQISPKVSLLFNEAPLLKTASKKCTCSKTKCLKLYCECFANGLVCGVDCGCKGCCNTDDHSDLIVKAQ